jgi:2-polyprenyl-6-methoxyphenol hydroxylase-like FAD-dependent oxidoreductase
LLVPIDTGGEAFEVRARLVVGADGGASGVRRWVGAKTIRDPVRHAIGGLLVEGVDLDPNASHIGFYPGGASMVFRQASDRARIYLVCRPEDAETMRGPTAARAIMAAGAASLPEGALERARAVGPAAFFPGADIFASRITGAAIVLIGDAAGANDPTQGQGLSLTFKDVSEVSHRLLETDNWREAIDDFARERPRWYEPLRAHASWKGSLMVGIGPEADAARARAERAAMLDPLLGGYGVIHSVGPDGLAVTQEARRHFFGEDLDAEATAAD